MNIEEIVRTSMDTLARDIQPTVPDPAAVRGRVNRGTRVRQIVAVGLAAAVTGAVLVGIAQFRDADRTPTPPAATLGQMDGAVWMVGTDLHIGDQTFPQQSAAFNGLAPTRNGAVYATRTGDIVYQPVDGPAKVIASGQTMGLAANPDSDLVAWMQFSDVDQAQALWLYDVGRDKAITDVPMFDQVTPVRWVGHNDQGKAAVLFGGQKVSQFESTVGAGGNTMVVGSAASDVTREVFARADGPYRVTFTSPDGAELSSFVGIKADGGLSHDGAYYAGLLADVGTDVAIGVVDTATGEMRPLDLPAADLLRGVFWSSGHTLITYGTTEGSGTDAGSGVVVACDADTLVCATVAEFDDVSSVVLPTL